MDHNQLTVSPNLVRALSFSLITALLPFIILYCLPLLKPVGVSILQRLWSGFLFIIVTAALLLGILNTQRTAQKKAHQAFYLQTSSEEDNQAQIKKNVSSGNEPTQLRVQKEDNTVHQAQSFSAQKRRRHRKASSLDQNFSFQPLTIPRPFQEDIFGSTKLGGQRYKSSQRRKERSPVPIDPIQEGLQAPPPPFPYSGFPVNDVDFVMYSSDTSVSPDSTFSKGKGMHIKSPRINESGQEATISPDELNRRAEAFIAKFHEQMRLQRLESLERHKQMLDRAN